MRTNKLWKITIIAVATTCAILAIPASSLARQAPDPIHNAPRCEAHLILASCNLDECKTKSPDNIDRCDDRFRRDLKRPNRRYDCGFNTCDSGELARKLAKVEREYAYCKIDSEIERLGNEGLDECIVRCEARLDGVWRLAEENFCDDIAVPESCEELD